MQFTRAKSAWLPPRIWKHWASQPDIDGMYLIGYTSR